ncbi:MAG: flagellin [Anaerobiospirillum succiniciproducens]|uniref:flagellin N-terminal helical domain-containing protein n=1 Tax=Anaerobiospirillum succiniciproducens TaxID=13335 RepID=UPI0026DCE9A8|nr:flagellin [Anaerobiospirillum succiniciproducens]MDO4675339.1 flagellin [Anaerobiospirillum succiniciproducens]
MPLFINTNVSSLYAQRAAQRANDALDISYQRLSSGLRINRAKDDAAGMQVSNNLTTQLDGLTQGNRNAQDGLAFAQTIEGALDEVTNMLQRIRTLAVQASNGTMSDQDRNSLQVEVTQLADEITRISNDTTFAGADVLNGNASISRFQVGADPSSIIEMDLRDGTDINGIVKMLVRYTGKDEFTNPMVTDPANPGGHALNLKFEDIFKNNGTNPGIRVEKASAAQATLAGIDGLINAIDRKRAELGAMQNRLEATVRNQESVKENVASSRATIRDTDFAEETANLTQQQIIQQATATILTQANQRPQIALSLMQK